MRRSVLTILKKDIYGGGIQTTGYKSSPLSSVMSYTILVSLFV